MTDTEEYNGWTNRETWATASHIDNDEGFYNYRLELRAEVLRDSKATGNDHPEYALGNQLQEWIEGLAEEVYSPAAGVLSPPSQNLLGMFHDIGSIWRVNWYEIAANFLSEEHDGDPKLATA